MKKFGFDENDKKMIFNLKKGNELKFNLYKHYKSMYTKFKDCMYLSKIKRILFKNKNISFHYAIPDWTFNLSISHDALSIFIYVSFVFFLSKSLKILMLVRISSLPII